MATTREPSGQAASLHAMAMPLTLNNPYCIDDFDTQKSQSDATEVGELI
jgi:hypothetical protein